VRKCGSLHQERFTAAAMIPGLFANDEVLDPPDVYATATRNLPGL
jgi:hypothetical protein